MRKGRNLKIVVIYKSRLEIFQKTSSCVPKAVPVCKTKPVKKCTKVSSQDIKSIK